MKRSHSPPSVDKPAATRRKLQMDLAVVPNNLSDEEHSRMDREVFETVHRAETEASFKKADDPSAFLSAAAFLLATIVSTSEPLLDSQYVRNPKAKALLGTHPNLAERLRVALKDGTFKEIRNLSTAHFYSGSSSHLKPIRNPSK
jgi:hypothetical protein